MIGRVMNQRDVRTRHIEMGYGRFGGLWTGVVAVLSGIVVLLLAVLFSALFLGLFVAVAVGIAVRAWLAGRNRGSAQPEVIDAEYTVVDAEDSRRPGSKP